MKSDNASEPSGIPASYLLHARAMSAWGNSVGMTATQKEIYLYVASMLATNDQCWISISRLASEIGRTRRGCQKAVADGKSFFEHDHYDKDAQPDTKRLWKLVLPVPSKKELAQFMPGKKGIQAVTVTAWTSVPATNEVRTPLRTTFGAPPANDFPQSSNTLTTFGCLEENKGVNRSLGGGGADQHHHQKVQQRNRILGDWLRAKPIPTESKDYPRQTAIQLLSDFQVTAKRMVAEAAVAAGISDGSPEWNQLFPRDGSAVYKPSDADLEYLIPLVDTAVAKGQSALPEFARNMPGWVQQQIKLAIQTKTPFRECLRVSALAQYMSNGEVFQPTEQPDEYFK